ncbi:PKD domain-containing protein [Mangrovibacterium sp.]|uniref:PKD domain-containing protein n=1 Tax=Mangrovibacterium sp. TaxID=1961364 RepID=UPI0035653989
MKKIIWLFCLFVIAINIQAQNKLTTWEYWFDNDYTTSVEQDIGPSETIYINQVIDVSALQFGLHTLHSRVKDERGIWGSVSSRFFAFYQGSETSTPRGITKLEYWFDNKPDESQPVTFTAGSPVNIEEIFDVSGLGYGLHTLHFRTKDDRGIWGPTTSRFFSYYRGSATQETEKITRVQYWLDNRFDEAVNTETSPTNSLKLDESIDVSTLTYGLHTIHHRLMDERGIWSPVVSRFFSHYPGSGTPTSHQISQYQYWLNENFDEAVTENLPDAEVVALDQINDVASLRDGLHRLNFRFRESNGKWGSVVSHFFTKYTIPQHFPGNEIVAYRYWIDDDLTTLQTKATESPDQVVILDEVLDIDQLSSGEHFLNIQFQDKSGRWSSATGETIIVEPSPNASPEADTFDSCPLQSIQFTANEIDTDEILWEFGDGETSATFNPIHHYEIAGSYTVKVTVTHTATGKTKEIQLVDPIVIHETYDVTNEQSICSRELPYIFGTQQLDEAGIYTETFQSIYGCDSIVTLQLIVKPVYESTESRTVCSIELPITFGSQSISAAGQYIETLTAANGCDSLATLNLSIKAVNNPEINAINNQIVDEDSSLEISLTGIDDGDDCATAPLQFSLSPTNNELIESYQIVYTDGDSSGTLKLQLKPDANGQADLTLTLENTAEALQNSVNFSLSVNPVNDPPVLLQSLADLAFTTSDKVLAKYSSEIGVVFNDVDLNDQLSLTLTQSNGAELPSGIIFRNDSLLTVAGQATAGCWDLRLRAIDLTGAEASDSFELCLTFPTGTAIIETGGKPIIYPNPTTGRAIVQMPPGRYASIQMAVSDMLGTVRIQQTLDYSPEIPIDLSQLLNGNYIVRLRYDGKETIFHLVISH